MTTTATCPYPWCSALEFEGGTVVTDSVASCGACGSLASRCPERDCRAWNRAFVRWCRRCGRDLGEVSSVWDELRSAHPPGGPAAIDEPSVVADLSHLDGPAKSRAHRVALSAAQGFLVVHQAGGFVALVRPFSPPGAGLAFDFREPESPMTAAPAFEPSMLPGGRSLLLADRRGASVVDLWDTKISAAAPSNRIRRLATPGPLAVAPMALGASKIGLLVGVSAPYSWLVWDLAEPDPTPASARSSLRPLPIAGGPCEASAVAGRALAFATPEGHWIWRIDDAASGRVDAIRSTWPAPGSISGAGHGPAVAVARRAENPEAFANPSQVFLANTPGGAFYWHFRTTDDRARSYRVNPADLSIDDRSEHDGVAPIGLAARPGQKRLSLIFDKNDTLLEERDIRGQLAPCQVVLPGEGRSGLQLVGTLVVTIRNARGDSRSRPIEIQSLWGGRPPVRTDDITGLASDPFVWSGQMFTVERPGDDRLCLVRRSLIPSSSEVPR